MQRTTFSRTLCVLIAGLLYATNGSAQTITSGLVTGKVTDHDGAALTDVLVLATPVAGGAPRTAYTDHQGAFRFSLMPTGRYFVSAEKIGYKPKVVDDLSVAANARVILAIILNDAPPPVEASEHVAAPNVASGSRAGSSEASLLDLQQIPFARRELSELGGFASAATSSLEIEGLPSWLSSVYVDGVPYTAARHPRLSRALQREVALPLNSLSSAEVVTGDPDAEWGGFAAGALAATTRSGGNEFNARGFGSWAGSALQSTIPDASSLASNSVWGGLSLNGPLMRDTAQYSVAFEARRLQTPTASLWSLDNTATEAVLNAGNAHGVQLGPYTRPYSFGSTAFSGAGRFDWHLGATQQLSVRAALGSFTPDNSGLRLASASAPESALAGKDVLLSATLGSLLGNGWAQELRASLGSSTRETQSSDGDLVPSTRIAGGTAFGIDPRLPGSFRRTDFRLGQSLQIPSGQHEAKLGFDAVHSAHHHAYDNSTGSEFSFGGADQFANGTGIFVSELSSTRDIAFSTTDIGAYVQDNWRAAPGVLVLGALRYDVELLPTSEVHLDKQWLRATALSNSAIPARSKTVSPRFGLTWDVGERGSLIVRASAGRYGATLDPMVLSEAITQDGDLTVRSQFGNVNAWPQIPTANPAAVRLTLLAPNFRAPRSDRASLGISTTVSPGTVLLIAGAYRATNYLPRRQDLNLTATPVYKDQYGRSVYGTLMQFGELLTAGQSNRRFDGYERVSAINADGSAEYRGITLGLEHGSSARAGYFLRYTYSRTVDDWPIRRTNGAEADQSPLADAPGPDWRHGTSDYDLPHRLVAGVQLQPVVSMRPRIAVMYRYQSGYPFTPGFRDGVDANGDGVSGNDPAFVDKNVSGITELAAKWSCLGSQAGSFARRNSCREPSLNTFDARVDLTLLNGKRTSGQLFVEGLNLLDAGNQEIDRAVFLVDPARSLVINQGTGLVTVPLIANPNFGKPVARFGNARMLRIGFQVTH